VMECLLRSDKDRWPSSCGLLEGFFTQAAYMGDATATAAAESQLSLTGVEDG
jgi:hypothetical protein